jgi:hypothetical protein
MRASPDHSVDDFLAQVNAMKKRLDSERARKSKDGTGDGDADGT